MENNSIPETLRRLEIPDRVKIIAGHGGLPLVQINTPWSTAEIYLHGAHVTGFQKTGEPPVGGVRPGASAKGRNVKPAATTAP